MTCVPFDIYTKYLSNFDQSVEIDKGKTKPLRFNVWKSTDENVQKMLADKSVDNMPQTSSSADASPQALSHTTAALGAMDLKNLPKALKQLLLENSTIANSIALSTVLDSVTGEGNKAGNLGVPVDQVTNDGKLPVIPLARLAATVGRKISFQRGHRFKAVHEDGDTAEDIERMYYQMGMFAIEALEQSGVVKLHTDIASLVDYTPDSEYGQKPKKGAKSTVTTSGSHVKTVSLDLAAFPKQDATYFTHNVDVDKVSPALASTLGILKAVKLVSEPRTVVMPDSEVTEETLAELSERDGGTLDDTTTASRKSLYEKPIYVNTPVHKFMTLMNAEVLSSGKAASAILKDLFRGSPMALEGIFGVKKEGAYSIDKRESTKGQNLSQTTPIDDMAEFYDVIQGGATEPAPLHMPMKDGRNARLYYHNSVLNAHASKTSRYSLTAGKQDIKVNSDDFKYLVHQINESIGGQFTYDQITGQAASPDLDKALEYLESFNKSSDLNRSLGLISHMGTILPGKDYATILVGIQAIADVRNPKSGNITTEFAVSEDATASGGTLTMAQAISSTATGKRVQEFMQRIGFLKSEDGSIVAEDGVDMYSLMQEAVGKYLSGEISISRVATDAQYTGKRNRNEEGTKDLISSTLSLLYPGEKGARDFAKGPTMTFVYRQGAKGATESNTASIADRIIDSLDSSETQQYLENLLGEKELNHATLVAREGLYLEIKEALVAKGVPQQMHSLLESSINQEFLKEYSDRGSEVFAQAMKLGADSDLRILPAAAVLAGVEPTIENLKKYGMPMSKLLAISHTDSANDTVLTFKNNLQESVANVTPIHSIDSAALYRSTLEADSGLIVVHDEVRGSIKDVRGVVAQYTSQVNHATASYDVHQQILIAVAAYSKGMGKDIHKSSKFQSLETRLADDLAYKAKVLKESFNKETTSLIGSGDAYLKYAKNSTDVTESSFTGSAPTLADAVGVMPKSKADLGKVIDSMAAESEVITTFLSLRNRPGISKQEKDVYSALTDSIGISMTAPASFGARVGVNAKAPFKLEPNNPLHRAVQKEIIEHEITHALTSAYLWEGNKEVGTDKARDVQYIRKAVDVLKKKVKNLTPEQVSKIPNHVYDRMRYITTRKGTQGVSEMVAVLYAEPEAAKAIYSMVGNKTGLAKAIDKLVAKVIKLFMKITEGDLNSELDVQLLYSAIGRAVEEGTRIREQDGLSGNTTGGPSGFSSNVDNKEFSMKYVNHSINAMLEGVANNQGRRLVTGLHKLIGNKFPMYLRMIGKLEGYYGDSAALQQLVHTITGEGVNKVKKADILSAFSKVSSQQVSTLNDQLNKFAEASRVLSAKEKKGVYELVTQTSLHDYFVLAGGLSSADSIADEVKRLQTLLSPEQVRRVTNLVNANTQKDGAISEAYNLNSMYDTSSKSEMVENIRKFAALKGIQEVGVEKLEVLLGSTDLLNLVKDSVVANALAVETSGGVLGLKDSLMADYFSEPTLTQSVAAGNIHRYINGEDTGWKVLRAPKDGSPGIVYRQTVDSTHLSGVFTDAKLATSDVEHKNDAGETVTLRLTESEKAELGASSDFGEILAHNVANSLALQDSQVIRDEVLKAETRTVVTSQGDVDKLADVVNSDNVDNPWFVKLPAEIAYHSLPKHVQAKYKSVKGRASNVKGFDKEVTLVRKDISHWLLGDSSSSLLSSNTKVKWATRIAKDLIAASKIGMVVLNPVKILNDNISNVTYLGVMGVSPLFIANSYKDIATAMGEYRDTQYKITKLRIQTAANPTSATLKAEMADLEVALTTTSLGDIDHKGFINSLGGDIVAKSGESSSGLHADMHTALTFLLKNDKGNKNILGQFISKAHNLGSDGEGFLNYLGGLVGKHKSMSGTEGELLQVAERLRSIRTDDDVVNYIAQYTTSPASMAVKVGASITDMSDVAAKETLYRYLVEKEGMSSDDARIKVLDSFPDYKENMPLAIKQASDVGILMFPSFWLRIQKAIYRMAKDKPAGLATEELIQVALGTNSETILGSNILSKSQAWGGLAHNPLDNMSPAGLIPSNLW
jgi:hypothetical protein